MIRTRFIAALAVACALTLTSCGTGGSATSTPATTGTGALTSSSTLNVVTHDSFNLEPALLEQFKKETGYTVRITSPGDAGTVVNQLVLTKDAPTADVVFGIDNTYAGRAIEQGVVEPYESPAASGISSSLSAGEGNELTPIDFGDVCVNADKSWFAAKGLALPRTIDDLAKPEYKDLLVVENPASSSPGLAFLAATYATYGADGWLDYWGKLTSNGVKVVSGWTEAYTVEFSGSSGKGTRPLVVSYSTSPADEVPSEGGQPATTALLDTCFRQVEYAGVIKGATNEVGARKFIDFLLSDAVQQSFPTTMYMYPAQSSTELPDDWTTYAPLATNPLVVSPEVITHNRDQWIKDWTAKVLG